jgi:hypothetical protein
VTRWRRGTSLTTLCAFCVGLVGSLTAAAFLKARPPGGAERWTRTNYTGRPVTLLEGPAFVVSAVAGALAGGAGAPAAVAGLGAGAFGVLDDLVGGSPSKGLGGHLAAAGRGEVTTGAIKVVGLCGAGLLTAWIIDRPRIQDAKLATLVGAAVIAGSANIANLLDLRPGRALKVVLLFAAPLLAAGRGKRISCATAGGVAGAAIGALPDDLAGRSMLGDTGANSAGAMIGSALVARTGLRGRLLALLVVTGLTLASEKISFTTVIESTPGLRELDALGRPPR